MPIIAPMADGSHDASAASQSFHAAALSLLDEDGELETASSATSMRDVATASVQDQTKPSSTQNSSPTDTHTAYYTAPTVDDTWTDQQPSRLSYYTADGDQDHDEDHEPDHQQSHPNPTRSLKPFSDIDLLLRRRASFPLSVPDDREDPELDTVFEPDVSPTRNSVLFPSELQRSRRSSAYTLNSNAPSRTTSFGERQAKISPLPTPLPSPTRRQFDGLPETSELDEPPVHGLRYRGKRKSTVRINGTNSLPKSDTVSSDMTATSDVSDLADHAYPPRPSAPTPTKSNSLNTHMLVPKTPVSDSHVITPTYVASPESGAPPSTVTMSDMLKQLKRQESIHPEPKPADVKATQPLSIKDVQQYAAFCLTLWWKAANAAVHSVGEPSHILHILAFAILSTVLPIIQYFLRFSQDTWTGIRAKYRIPSIPQLLRIKHENDYTLFDCLSKEQADAGKLALSVNRHSDTARVFDLDAARLLLQLNALLNLREVNPTADRFAKQGEQYVRLSAAALGLEYTPVSELNTNSSACCAAFYDLKSNWIVLAFKGESMAEVDEVIINAMSPSVHVGQHIHGFGKARSCYSDRLFPRRPSTDSRMPYHTIIRTVRIIASQLPTAEPIQLYFTGHGSGAAIASLAMAAALDASAGDFGETVEVSDGYVFGAPTICDKKSVREFNHKEAKQWERPRVLWRVVNRKDSLARHKSWNFDTTTQQHLGTGLELTAHSSKVLVLDKHTSRTSLSASHQPSPRGGGSLRPERAQNDTSSRLRRLVQDWPVVGGLAGHSLGAYWEVMKNLQDLEFEWK
ncbi:hypothetical protein CALVIDRAFT_566675 [Calocera viscosa TUFC12733]|uniref:Fungal lipase-type domain-containing protein n=1 Tax=Calocera viscosa (strain TUFC12733) TaxID=1330018 RepID=A0A167J2P3_CALVF|nr:hypothetical protein CALVIDRAFT_566675 [Calocera viscosa TUFC12733]